jgi:hypothetical protein
MHTGRRSGSKSNSATKITIGFIVFVLVAAVALHTLSASLLSSRSPRSTAFSLIREKEIASRALPWREQLAREEAQLKELQAEAGRSRNHIEAVIAKANRNEYELPRAVEGAAAVNDNAANVDDGAMGELEDMKGIDAPQVDAAIVLASQKNAGRYKERLHFLSDREFRQYNEKAGVWGEGEGKASIRPIRDEEAAACGRMGEEP